jgi:hypothetical protein
MQLFLTQLSIVKFERLKFSAAKVEFLNYINNLLGVLNK